MSKNLVLAAMIFAVSMMFIDQTIVSIAAPNIQRELGLTSTGIQWAINSYLLALAAFFAYGGRLADTLGHRRMVTTGIIVFALASLFCGLTPKGNFAEGWLIAFRAVQGFGGALMFPAALAIVVQTFQLNERGKALALFFGIAGGLTAVGPSLGGFLTQWTWRAIFWVNLPVAAVALVLTALAKPVDDEPARPDRLPRARPDRRRRGDQHLRLPAIGDVGLGRSQDDRLHRRRGAAPGRLRARGTWRPLAADRRQDLPDQAVLRREPRPLRLEPRVRPGLLLRERVRAGRAREVGVVREPGAPLLLPRVRRRGPDRRPHARSHRRETPGRRRMHPRGGRVLALGERGRRS